MDQQARAEKVLEQYAREGDGAEWRRLLREAAALGHRGAAGHVRAWHDEDEEGGAAVLQEEQRKGCVWSTNWLGRCYEDGWGVEKDLERAAALYKEAAEAGDVDAKNNLGCCYKNGWGVQEDHERAVALFKEAAEAGNVVAKYNLGLCYMNGWGVTKNLDTAADIFLNAGVKSELSRLPVAIVAAAALRLANGTAALPYATRAKQTAPADLTQDQTLAAAGRKRPRTSPGAAAPPNSTQDSTFGGGQHGRTSPTDDPTRSKTAVPAGQHVQRIRRSDIKLEKKPIAKGGFVKVFRGEWRGALVAVKRLELEDGAREIPPQVLYETAAVIHSSHPNVIRIFGVVEDFTSDPDEPFIGIVMEYFEDGALHKHVGEGMSAAAARTALLDIARGLAAVHAQGFAHLDLKSANVLVRKAGGGLRAVVTDFGLARALEASGSFVSRVSMAGTPRTWRQSSSSTRARVCRATCTRLG